MTGILVTTAYEHEEIRNVILATVCASYNPDSISGYFSVNNHDLAERCSHAWCQGAIDVWIRVLRLRGFKYEREIA